VVEAVIDRPALEEEISFADVRAEEGRPAVEAVIDRPALEEEISFADVRVEEGKPAVEAVIDRPALEEEVSFADVALTEERPVGETVLKPADEEPQARKSAWHDKIEIVMREPEIPVPPEPAPLAEMMVPAQDEDVERVVAAMKDLPPPEAFAHALTELKKTFQAEIDALKEEIRLLKNAG